MTQSVDYETAVRNRIAQTIRDIQPEHELFQDLDAEALTSRFLKLFLEQWQPRDFLAIPDDEFRKTIRGLMGFERAHGMLTELTPEQMEAFDAAVENPPIPH